MKFFLAFITMILLNGCSVISSTQYSEEIVGVWYLKDFGSGNYEYSELGISSDGRKCVVSVEFNQKGEPEVSYYDNTWLIENGVFITVVGNSPSSSLPKGYVIRDHIKLLNKNELHLLMESSSSYVPRLEKHQRLSGVSPERICNIVENYSRYAANTQ